MRLHRQLKWFITILLAHISLIIHAQIKVGDIMLPAVERAKNGNCKVFSTWKPSKKFLKNNPSFLKNGSYSMSANYINVGKKNLKRYHYYPNQRPPHHRHHDYEHHFAVPADPGRHVRFYHIVVPNSSEFTSLDYPAVWIPSNKRINTGGHVFIQVLCLANYGVQFPLCKGYKAHKKKKIGYLPNYSYLQSHPQLKNAYDNLNKYYKEKTKEIINRKFSNPVYLSNIGSSEIDSVQYGANDLCLQFEYIETQSVNDHFFAPNMVAYFPNPFFFLEPWNYALMYTRRKSSSVYPSNQLIRLHVKNMEGKEIKTYNQVIFVKEKHLVGLGIWAPNRESSIGLIFKQTLPAAIENLISQFAEDTAIMKEIEGRQKKLDTVQNNPELVKYVQQHTDLAVLDESEHALELSISEADGKLADAENRANTNVVDFSNANPDLSNASIGGALLFIAGESVITGVTNSIYKSVAHKQVARLTAKDKKLRQKLEKLQKDKGEIKLEQTNTPIMK